MKTQCKRSSRFQHPQLCGFSLLELLIVLAVLSAVLGFLFSSLGEGQKMSAMARDEMEMQQELQDVLSLMKSELRTAGFPPASFYESAYLENPNTRKNLVAKGLMEAQTLSLMFQGDINGDGKVDQVRYFRDVSSPLYLKRKGGQIHDDGTWPGSTQVLSDQVENLEFKYFNSLGVETSILSEMTSIEIHLTLRTKRVDPISHGYRTASQVARVSPPNL